MWRCEQKGPVQSRKLRACRVCVRRCEQRGVRVGGACGRCVCGRCVCAGGVCWAVCVCVCVRECVRQFELNIAKAGEEASQRASATQGKGTGVRAAV